jgi:tetratricopeptide (TPR) repeat protein
MKLFKFFIFLGFLFLSFNSEATLNDHPLFKVSDQIYNAEFEKAEKKILDYLHNTDPNDPLAYILLGVSLDWKQQVQDLQGKLDDEIIEIFERANLIAFRDWDKDQDNVDKMVILGNSYMYLSKKWLDKGKKARAGLILKKCKKYMYDAIEKNPERYDAYMAVGIFNYYADNIPSGLKFIAKLLGISGDEKLGLEQMEKAATNPNIFQADALFMLSYTLGQKKSNYLKAEELLKKIVKLYPDNPMFRYYLADHAFRAKRFGSSNKYFEEFLDFCDTHFCSQKLKFYGNLFIAEAYVKSNKHNLILPHILKAEELIPKHRENMTAKVHLYKGYAYKSLGQKSKAIEEFNQSKKAKGNSDSISKKADLALAKL